MSNNYKDILDQAKKEKERVAMQADNPATLQVGKDDLVNLCVRVPKSWRSSIKSKAVQYDMTLEKLVIEAINQYVEKQGW
jgi:predicted HicB family RNase H-like nuclease